jgi:hypothetical protein
MKGFVVSVEVRPTLGFWPPFDVAGCGEERFDDFVAQDDQSAHGPQTLRRHLLATGGFDLANQVFGAKFLQVVGNVTRAVLPLGLITEGANLRSQGGGREAAWGVRQSQNSLGHPAHAKLMEVDSSHPSFPHPGGQGQLLEGLVGDKVNIRSLESVEEALHHAPQWSHDGWEMR